MENEKKIYATQILSWICALMLLAMIVMTFLPYWTCEVSERVDGERITYTQTPSLSAFSWFPKEHEDLQKDFEKATGMEINVNDEVTMPVLLLLLGAVGTGFAIFNGRSVISAAAATLLGAYSTYTYLTSVFLGWGASLGAPWSACLAVSIAATAVGAVCVALHFVFTAKEKKAMMAKQAQV